MPTEIVAVFLDEQGKIPPEAEAEARRVLLGLEAISDVVRVAAALNMSCVLVARLNGKPILDILAMRRDS